MTSAPSTVSNRELVRWIRRLAVGIITLNGAFIPTSFTESSLHQFIYSTSPALVFIAFAVILLAKPVDAQTATPRVGALSLSFILTFLAAAGRIAADFTPFQTPLVIAATVAAAISTLIVVITVVRTRSLSRKVDTNAAPATVEPLS